MTASPTEQVAERILAQTWGGRVRLAEGVSPRGDSERANVLRCAVLDAPSGAPASIIVKRVRVQERESYDPAATEGPSVRLFNDWAGLQFLSELRAQLPPESGAESGQEPPLAPRFFGGDRAEGVLVMEDLGEGDSLVQPLLGSDRAAAVGALDAYFRSLGRLNAVTYGHQASYWQIRDALGPRALPSQPTLEGQRRILERHFNALCEQTGITPVPGADADLVQAAALDVNPDPFLAFSQSDVCPDNCTRSHAGDWMRFFDFEWGWFRNVLNDGARARACFPTCWCVNRLPDDVIRRCEAVYRAEFAKGCPAAADDVLFQRALVTACAYWSLFSMEFYGVIWEQDDRWGIATVRQRIIVRLALLAQATHEFGYMEAFGETAARLVNRLQTMWPDLEPMPYYPAFR
jgi:hypothetical protein